MSTDDVRLFSIVYLDRDGVEVKVDTPMEDVHSIQLKVNIKPLVPNRELGTAILKGFMQERTDEMVRFVAMNRAKEREANNSNILQPGITPGLRKVVPDLKVVH